MFSQQQKLQQWLQKLKLNSTNITLLTGDASFRKYYRLQHNNQNYIVMYNPSQQENLLSFITIGKSLQDLNIRTPKIYDYDLQNSFALLFVYFDKNFNNYFGRYSIIPLLNNLIKIKKLTGELYTKLWLDIGTLNQLHKAQNYYAINK